ncbi:hypothetical protein SYYSPA8_30960 [Streptomyces yaizuensis]|uniref:Uncharacterized protein n=1 Tax=Streptomyces yaizuensis TaxID=2989713 RepID=A0ABQ5P993_9ACTN|nr:hypothetical protein SYYSPA8_30960 [Streptomyces sp. YSPA8]
MSKDQGLTSRPAHVTLPLLATRTSTQRTSPDRIRVAR